MNKVFDFLWNFIEKIVYFFLSIGFRLIKKEMTDEIYDGFMQFIKFGIVGVSNTIISYVLYAVSLLLFQKNNWFVGYDYFISQIISFALSVLWSFYWNNKMVFVVEDGQERSTWKALIKTYISYSFTGLFLNSALLVLWIQVLHISEFIAPIINLLIGIPINFLINKFWAFKSR